MEVARSIMPTTCRYRAGMGEWLLRYEVINCGSWYPKSQAALGGLRRPVQYATFFIRDLDNNQFQPNILHDFANDTVAPYTFPVFFSVSICHMKTRLYLGNLYLMKENEEKH